MKKFTTFYFEDFSFDSQALIASFKYSFDKEEFFVEEIDFSSSFSIRDTIDLQTINSLLFHCHIALGISYYKLFPTEKLVVLSGQLDSIQLKFWKKFYISGLGEFLVKNSINPKKLFNFISESSNSFEKHDFEVSNRALLPWGGGKDSIVSSILLEDRLDFTPHVFGKIDSIKSETLSILGAEALLVKRRLSETLFKLNAKGYYNGHVPITGIIAFISIVVAYLYNYKYVILSNELSASESNTTWEGLEINHQYSKSLEFEQDFDRYISEHLTSDIKYFSLLRGFHEYKIAEIFSTKAQKYFHGFASCNKNFVITTEKKHKGSWCDRCEKCAFVFLILSAFLDSDSLVSIFGENLFEHASLEITFAGLIGYHKDKPFECVGTHEESTFAMYKAIQNYRGPLPYILNKFSDIVVNEVEKLGENKIQQKLVSRSNEDIIPTEIKKLIF